MKISICEKCEHYQRRRWSHYYLSHSGYHAIGIVVGQKQKNNLKIFWRMEIVTNKELLHNWQNRLGLTDWAIELQDNAIPADFINTECEGEVEYKESTKTAIIRIIRPDCYGEKVKPFNFERILIHELLHLKLALLDDSGNALQDRLVHQLIDDLARAFVPIKL